MPSPTPPDPPPSPPPASTYLFRFADDGTVRFHDLNTKLELRKRKRQPRGAGEEDEEEQQALLPEKVRSPPPRLIPCSSPPPQPLGCAALAPCAACMRAGARRAHLRRAQGPLSVVPKSGPRAC